MVRLQARANLLHVGEDHPALEKNDECPQRRGRRFPQQLAADGRMSELVKTGAKAHPKKAVCFEGKSERCRRPGGLEFPLQQRLGGRRQRQRASHRSNRLIILSAISLKSLYELRFFWPCQATNL